MKRSSILILATGMRCFFLLALFCLVRGSSSQKCPAKYKRFAPEVASCFAPSKTCRKHTFCLPENPACEIMRNGVSQQDKELILKLHNEFRSKVAMGNEEETKDRRRLPQAADMMQMEWDDELASVAQKLTETCHYSHDCHDCRAVEKFGVGQNIGLTNFKCNDPRGVCLDPTDEPEWTSIITMFYNEVKDLYTSWLSSFEEHEGPETGHFTQLLWSTSWRVGCGYSFYKVGGKAEKFYACNYGPEGNLPRKPVYKPGQPCSACPTNAHCSNSFPGLCKMNDANTAPAYPINPQGILFYCGASSSDPDCKGDLTGDGRLETVKSVGGNYYSIALKGGQSATLSFNKPIVPHANEFCIVLTFRKGPEDAARSDESSLIPNFKISRLAPFNGNPLSTEKTASFITIPISLSWGKKTELSFIFSVPRGAGRHIVDIRRIMVYDGECAARKD